MARTNVKDLADRLIPGGLRAWLKSGRDQGVTLDQMARNLEDQHGISVTDETVRLWCQSFGIPTHRPGTEPAEVAS